MGSFSTNPDLTNGTAKERQEIFQDAEKAVCYQQLSSRFMAFSFNSLAVLASWRFRCSFED